MHPHPLHLVALQGSVRPGNNTAKALRLLADEVTRHDGVTLEIIDPTHLHLPLPGQGTSDDVAALQAHLQSADGVILATPEYHGSFSSVMKLLIDNLGFPSALAGKPVALVGVASGRVGAIKALEHLRSVASHVGALVLPGPVSIAGVRRAFDEDGNLYDTRTEERLRGVIHALVHYIRTTTCPRMALENMVRGVAAAA